MRRSVVAMCVAFDNIQVGMAVTSHDPSTLNTSTFDDVELVIPR